MLIKVDQEHFFSLPCVKGGGAQSATEGLWNCIFVTRQSLSQPFGLRFYPLNIIFFIVFSNPHFSAKQHKREIQAKSRHGS